jgi:RNA-binding protein
MQSDQEFKKRLRGIGHKLHPVVTVAGNGLSEALMAEAERALSDHELVKIRFAVDDREQRRTLIALFCDQTGARAVQQIGKVLLAYRPNLQSEARLSNLKRNPD